MAHKAYTDLTVGELKASLTYFPLTGKFIWKAPIKPRQHNKVGKIATKRCTSGHNRIFLKGKRFLASRLAWLYMTGEWPKEDLDHINRIRDDDRFKNLREATEKNNARNGGGWKRRKQKYKGVYPQKKSSPNPWFSAIRVDRKLIYLGSFPTQKVAHAAYVAAAKKYFGEFACAGH